MLTTDGPLRSTKTVKSGHACTSVDTGKPVSSADADKVQNGPQQRRMPANSEASGLRMEFNNGGGEVIRAHNDDGAGSVASRKHGAKIADLSRFWSSIDADPRRP
jgi:hypothetical protein